VNNWLLCRQTNSKWTHCRQGKLWSRCKRRSWPRRLVLENWPIIIFPIRIPISPFIWAKTIPIFVANIMPTWIIEANRIIAYISIPIKCLRFSNARNHCVRLDKPAEQRVIESGIVIHLPSLLGGSDQWHPRSAGKPVFIFPIHNSKHLPSILAWV